MKPANHPLHHLHQRKRIYKHHEQYPPLDKKKRILDKIIYIAGLAGPVMTIPQLWTIWIDKNAAGVSPISWGAYAIIAAIWVLYGIEHKEKPIIITNSVWVIIEIFIVIGVLIHT